MYSWIIFAFSLPYPQSIYGTRNSCSRIYISDLRANRRSSVHFCSLSVPTNCTILMYGEILTNRWIWSGHASPSIISTFISLYRFLMISMMSPAYRLIDHFSAVLRRKYHMVECAVCFTSFFTCVKPPCSFVMRLPNLLDCSMEVSFAKTFLFTPARTSGFLLPNGNNKK